MAKRAARTGKTGGQKRKGPKKASPTPREAGAQSEPAPDLMRRALIGACGFPQGAAVSADRLLDLARRTAWGLWAPLPDREMGTQNRAAFGEIAASPTEREARYRLALLAVRKARRRATPGAFARSFLLLAILARIEQRDDGACPEDLSAVAEMRRWLTLDRLTEPLRNLMRFVESGRANSEPEYDFCNRLEGMLDRIHAEEGEEWSARRQAELQHAGIMLLRFCREMLLRVEESTEADLWSAVAGCSKAAEYHAERLSDGTGPPLDPPVKMQIHHRDAKDLPPLVELELEQHPHVRRLLTLEVSEPLGSPETHVVGWHEDPQEPGQFMPVVKHGDLAKVRASVIATLRRYIRFLETIRLPGLLTADQLASCMDPSVPRAAEQKGPDKSPRELPNPGTLAAETLAILEGRRGDWVPIAELPGANPRSTIQQLRKMFGYAIETSPRSAEVTAYRLPD